MLGDLALFFPLRATIGERMYGPKAAFMAAIPSRAGPIRLKTAPEHPWGHRTAVLPWYVGAQSAPPVKTWRN